MIREAIYATFRKLFSISYRRQLFQGGVAHLLTARLARVLVAITCIFQLGTALEVLEDQLVGSSTHDGPRSCTLQ